MRIEAEKTRRAFQIGRDCGLFRVPKVLDYDEANGILVFERIDGIHPISSTIRRCPSIVERVGRSLAIIHQNLFLPESMKIPLPSEFALAGTEVFLHGDFNGCNVCLHPCSKSIVIIDWQMTSRHGGRATYGSRYFDLIWFINYMLWKPSVSNLFHDPVSPVAKLLLESYLCQAGVPYDSARIEQYAKNFFSVKLPLRKAQNGWKARTLIHRSNALTQKFIKSLRE